MTLIAEDVLLLLLDDESGAFAARSDQRGPVLAGAVLAELALAGAVEIETETGFWKRTRVTVEDRGAVSDPVLLAALDEIDQKPRSPQDLVGRLGRRLPDELCDRLVERGLLRREESKVLGLFPRKRWPAADSRHEEELRADLRRVLLDGGDAEERTGTVIALLSAVDLVAKVVDRGPLSARDLKKRAKEVADASWASAAVRQAVQASQAAILAAVAAAGAVASSGS